MAQAAIIARPNDAASWITVREAAELLDVTERAVTHRATGWAKIGLARLAKPAKGKPQWMIHRNADARLARCPEREARHERALADLLDKHPRDYVERAMKRARWMNEWRRRLATYRPADADAVSIAREVADEAKEAEGAGFKISVSSLYLWWRTHQTIDPETGTIRGLEGLVDKYGTALPLFDDAAGTANRSPEAIEFFLGQYRTELKRSVSLCHRETLLAAKQNGWEWPESCAATRRWLARYDDKAATLLSRHGHRKYTSSGNMPYAEQDWGKIAPGTFYVSDHKECDFVIRHGKKLIRPWLTVVQDCGSRSVVGWHLGPSPHQDAIVSALRMALTDRSIPETIRIDNGKDFKSERLTGLTKSKIREMRKKHGKEWKAVVRAERARESDRVDLSDAASTWCGVFEALGVDVKFAQPYSPWAKGTMERWFRTLGEQCCKSFATWCGDKPDTKPECLKDILRGKTGVSAGQLELYDESAVVPTMDDARKRIATYLVEYHAAGHRGRGMDGRSPDDVWRTAERVRKASADALLLLLGVRGLYKVGGNGVHVKVSGGTVSFGRRSARLKRYKGREVLVSVDIDRPDVAVAIDPQTRRRIDTLECNEWMHPNATHDGLREQHAEIARDRALERKLQRGSIRRTRTAVQRANVAANERAKALAATGTDHAVSVVPVETGFEGASIANRPLGESRTTNIYANASLADIDWSKVDREAPPPNKYAHASVFDIRDDGQPEPDDEYAHIRIEDLRYDDDESDDDDAPEKTPASLLELLNEIPGKPRQTHGGFLLELVNKDSAPPVVGAEENVWDALRRAGGASP